MIVLYSASVTCFTVAIGEPSIGVITCCAAPDPIHFPPNPPGFTSSMPNVARKLGRLFAAFLPISHLWSGFASVPAFKRRFTLAGSGS